MNNFLQHRNIYLTISIFVLTCCLYFIYASYFQTIKIHVPIFGEIDTGITDYQLSQFKKAQLEYDHLKQSLKNKLNSQIITNNEYMEQMNQINLQYFSDKRITAVTSGPAKKFVNYLLK
jgi:hypothetical protein